MASMEQLQAHLAALNQRILDAETKAQQAEARAVQAEQQSQATQQGLAQVQQARQKGQGKGKGGEPGVSHNQEWGIGAFASKYQPQPFEGEDDKWKDWARVFRSWSGRFYEGKLAEVYDHIDAHRNDAALISDLEISMAYDTDVVRIMATELYHVLIMLTRGKAQKLVLKAGEREGLEAFRLLLRRYEPYTTATAVAKLVDLLSSQFGGDLTDAVTDFERRVAAWEHDTKESLSDLLKIGVVVKGLEKGNFRDHLLINTSQTTDWNKFIKEIENVELARKNTKITPMDLSAVDGQFNGYCSWCNAYGHMAKDCRKKQQYLRDKESSGQSPSWAASSWSPGAGSSKDGKSKGKGKKGKDGKNGGFQSPGKGKGKKGKDGKGKGKGKKGKKGLNEMEGLSDDWQSGPWNEQTWDENQCHACGDNGEWQTGDWSAGAWSNEEQWSSQSWSEQASGDAAGTATNNAGLSELGGLSLCAMEEYPNLIELDGSVRGFERGGVVGGDSAMIIESLGIEAVDTRTDRSHRAITFGIDTAACRTVVPANHPAARGYRLHKDAESGAAYSTAGKSLVYDEGRRVLVAKQSSGEPMSIDSRQARVRRPLMAVKPMTEQGQWVCFGPDRAFAYKIDTGRVVPFENTPSGWNLTVELEAPSDANEKLRTVMEVAASERRLNQKSTAARCSLPDKVLQMINGSQRVASPSSDQNPFGWQG